MINGTPTGTSTDANKDLPIPSSDDNAGPVATSPDATSQPDAETTSNGEAPVATPERHRPELSLLSRRLSTRFESLIRSIFTSAIALKQSQPEQTEDTNKSNDALSRSLNTIPLSSLTKVAQLSRPLQISTRSLQISPLSLQVSADSDNSTEKTKNDKSNASHGHHYHDGKENSKSYKQSNHKQSHSGGNKNHVELTENQLEIAAEWGLSGFQFQVLLAAINKDLEYGEKITADQLARLLKQVATGDESIISRDELLSLIDAVKEGASEFRPSTPSGAFFTPEEEAAAEDQAIAEAADDVAAELDEQKELGGVAAATSDAIIETINKLRKYFFVDKYSPFTTQLQAYFKRAKQAIRRPEEIVRSNIRSREIEANDQLNEKQNENRIVDKQVAKHDDNEKRARDNKETKDNFKKAHIVPNREILPEYREITDIDFASDPDLKTEETSPTNKT